MGLFAERLQAGGVQTVVMREVSALTIIGWKISPEKWGTLTQRVVELGRGGNTNSKGAHVSCLAKLPTLSLKDLGKCGLNLVPTAWLKALRSISTLAFPFSSRFFWVIPGGNFWVFFFFLRNSITHHFVLLLSLPPPPHPPPCRQCAWC